MLRNHKERAKKKLFLIKQAMEFVLKCIFYPIAWVIYIFCQIFPYLIMIAVVGGMLIFAAWSMIPKDYGAYYRFGSGLYQTVYLQSEWSCEVHREDEKRNYEVSCQNLNDGSIRNFFTDYYEEGSHLFR